jgi:uncharacterized protein YjiS (DUF1127 family)
MGYPVFAKLQIEFSILPNLFAFMKMPESPLTYQHAEMIMMYKRDTNAKMLDLSVSCVATTTHLPWQRAVKPTTPRFDPLADLRELLATWKLRHRTRGQLANADPVVLRDVGISEPQRFVEANKSFWEA